MFQEEASGKVKARAVFCDLDNECINKLKLSANSSLFNHDLMINHLEGSGGNCVRGNYSIGKEISGDI